MRTLANGTPQGSVISPLLFLLMVKDITESDNGVKLSMYADDSAVWKSGKDIALLNRHLHHYLNVISRFYSEWGLKISTTKTLSILFTRNTRYDTSIVNLKIDNSSLALEKEV